MWIRYREMFAWGYTEWKFIFVPISGLTEEEVNEWLKEQDLISNWSDKFREFEWEETKPPSDIIHEEIISAQSEIKYLYKKINLLKTMLSS